MLECRHLMLAVSDLADAREFYVDTLGLPVIEETTRMFAVRAGAVRLSVMAGGRRLPDDTDEGAPVTLLLATEDLDETCERLRDAGVIFIDEVAEAPGFMRHVPIVDPDNNVIYLAQYYRDPV